MEYWLWGYGQATERTCKSPSFEGDMRIKVYVILLTLALILLPVGIVRAEQRMALVIGNNEYYHATHLATAVADATDVGATLRDLGYTVDVQINLDRRAMNKAVDAFVSTLSKDTTAVFFYAGHGVEVRNANYLLPVDIKAETENDIAHDGLDLGRILSRIAETNTRFNLAIIDACRDNPFFNPAASSTRSLGGTRGLAVTNSAAGFMVVYSAGARQAAIDRLGAHDTDRNGLFTRELLPLMRRPGLTIHDIIQKTRTSVISKAQSVGRVQTPAVYDETQGGTFYFIEPKEASIDPKQITQKPVSDSDPDPLQAFVMATAIPDPAQRRQALERFLARYPDSAFAATVRQLIQAATEVQNHPPLVPESSPLVVAVDGGAAPLNAAAPADPDGDGLVIRITALPRGGSVRTGGGRQRITGEQITIEELASATFQPSGIHTGAAGAFSYEVKDGRGGQASGSVAVTILPPNRPPFVAAGRSVEVIAGAPPLSLDIRAPTDPDGDLMTIRVMEVPTQGLLAIAGTTTPLKSGDVLQPAQLSGVAYAPDGGASGPAGAFAYEVVDARGGRSIASYPVMVQAPNRPPVVVAAPPFQAPGNAGPMPLAIPQPADPDNDPVKVRITQIPLGGVVISGGKPVEIGDTLTPEQIAAAQFDPDGGFVGQAGSLVFEVTDARGGAATGTVAVTITVPNRAPIVANARTLDVIAGQEPTSLAITVPLDPDGDTLAIRVLQVPANGLVSVQGQAIRAGDHLTVPQLLATTFAVAEGFSGQAGRFEFEVADGRGGKTGSSIAFKVTQPNRPPVVAPERTVEAVAGAPSVPLNIAAPTDPDNDRLSLRVTEVPHVGAMRSGATLLKAGSTVTPEQIQAVTYAPENDFTGQAGRFAYEVSDNRGGSTTGGILLRVLPPPNRPPVLAAEQQFHVFAGVGPMPLAITSPTDPDGDILQARIEALPDNGAILVEGRSLDVGTIIAASPLPSLSFAPGRTPTPAAPLDNEPVALLKLTIDDGHGGTAPSLVKVFSRYHPCDQLASAPDNPESIAPGVPFKNIKSKEAIDACLKAEQDFSHVVRFQFQLARAYHKDGHSENTLKWYEVAARAGDAAAQLNLATLYYHGLGGSRDTEAAVRWFNAAAQQELPSAMNALGQMQYAGDGVPQNYDAAVNMFHRAADKGLGAAHHNLGICYYRGHGVNQDYAKALQHFREAEKQGHALASNNIGMMYYFGQGVSTNHVEAARYFRLAAERGYSMAQITIGKMYYNGEGVEKDMAKSIQWLVAASTSSDTKVSGDAKQTLSSLPRQALIIAAQAFLSDLGYNPGSKNGDMVKATRLSITNFEKSQKLVQSGDVSIALIEAMLQQKQSTKK